MSEPSGHTHLSEHHRVTLEHIARHPTTHNLEWDDVIGLLREVAEVHEEHDGKVKVTLGNEKLVLSRPRHKDVDEQTVLDLRRLFRATGVLPAGD